LKDEKKNRGKAKELFPLIEKLNKNLKKRKLYIAKKPF